MAANEIRLSQVNSCLRTSQTNYFFKIWWRLCPFTGINPVREFWTLAGSGFHSSALWLSQTGGDLSVRSLACKYQTCLTALPGRRAGATDQEAYQESDPASYPNQRWSKDVVSTEGFEYCLGYVIGHEQHIAP